MLETTDSGHPGARSSLVRLRTLPLLAVLALVAAGPANAAEPPNPDDLTQGVWELDLSKSRFCKPVPRQSRREIVDSGWGLISVHWTGVDAEGNAVDSWYVYRYDGDKYPASIGKPAAEAITWKLVNPHRVEFTHWSKDGEITEQLQRTVSKDGQEMTQVRDYVGPTECVDTQVFRRR